MTNFVVTYDLEKPGQDYNKITACLRNMDSFHLQRSVWLVRSAFSAKDLKALIRTVTDWNDDLSVFAVGADYATDDPSAQLWIYGEPALLGPIWASDYAGGLATLSRPPRSTPSDVLNALLKK